ncbi:MAG TPA: hypothetical protein VKS82_11825 [Streptosporangiaceae bacterium]|jgi:hypothetical protein|nr:hypothetical protein [Streptosporangiaceae bacterium]
MAWLWLNLTLGALFAAAIIGVPLWLVLTRPDRAPEPADQPGWWRSRVVADAAAAAGRGQRAQRTHRSGLLPSPGTSPSRPAGRLALDGNRR